MRKAEVEASCISASQRCSISCLCFVFAVEEFRVQSTLRRVGFPQESCHVAKTTRKKQGRDENRGFSTASAFGGWTLLC